MVLPLIITLMGLSRLSVSVVRRTCLKGEPGNLSG